MENSDSTVIRKFYWDCPWGSKRNAWDVTGSNESWIVSDNGANLDSGALGNITVTALKRL